MKRALDALLSVSVAGALAAESVARRFRRLSRTFATLRNALDAGEPEWRVRGGELYEGGQRVATIRPLCKWCRSVAAHGDVCAECREEMRGFGWDARKGDAS